MEKNQVIVPVYVFQGENLSFRNNNPVYYGIVNNRYSCFSNIDRDSVLADIEEYINSSYDNPALVILDIELTYQETVRLRNAVNLASQFYTNAGIDLQEVFPVLFL